MPRVSIVIPTYTRSDKLRECLASIVQYTDMEQTEVIVVGNGASDETKDICEVYREFPVTLLWYPEPLGYPKAVNHGIRAAKGEYIVLLNDDTVLLSQPRNEWIDVMIKPMLQDGAVGITGPLMSYDENSGQDFIIFFCVMIRWMCLREIGLLDEEFLYFGEDTEYCLRAKRKGWKVLRVPEEHPTALVPLDPNSTTLEKWKHDKVHTGHFRIWHDAESTIGRLPDCDDVLRESRARLRKLFGGRKTDWAKAVEGWFAEDEIEWLAEQVNRLPVGAVVVEIGSWKGRSSRAIADNLPDRGKLYCVDTFNGSSGEPDAHLTAKEREGDNVYMSFIHNLHDHIDKGTVIPIRMTSAHAAETLNNLRPDLIFIDGDHSAEGMKIDCDVWPPLLKEGGLLCGHDYYRENEGPHWVHVRQEVESRWPNVQKAATSIWYVRPHETKHPVYDCFPINDELDLLELRFNELDSVVDRWVITEAPYTHSGNPKPLYFRDNLDRFERWKHKITHIIVDDFDAILAMPDGPDKHWAIERHQRNNLMRGLTECGENDIILIGDCDEIPRAEAVATYRPEQGLTCLEMSMHYGYMNLRREEPWKWSRLMPYRMLVELNELEPKGAGPCFARYNWNADTPNYNHVIPNGGWHFSFMGGPDEWVRKLEATPHQEYNKPEFKDREVLQQRALNGEDILGRPNEPCYSWVEVDESYPQFVRDNLERFKSNQFIYEAPMHPESWQFVNYVKGEYPDRFVDKKVLECGSLNINGTVRQFFDRCDYTGIDLAEGDCVDVVASVQEWQEGRMSQYDVIISSEMLEHDETWQEDLKAMYAMLKPDGMLLITCAGPKRPEHGTTRTNDAYSSPFTAETNYYRNLSKEDLLGVLPVELFSESVIGYERGEEDLNFYGFKIEKPAEKPTEPATVLKFDSLSRKKHWTVTAEVSTKDRYTTTLPMCLSAIINQTRKPDKLKVYDDGEQKNLFELSPFDGLLKLAQDKGIDVEVLSTPRKGQVANHQYCLDNAGTDFIWRVDDDEIPEPKCLEILLDTIHNYGRGGEFDQIGAVGGLVHHPGNVVPLPPNLSGSLSDINRGNLQWHAWNSGPREVEHLYSTFLYRVDAAKEAGGYPMELSPIGHREESIFSARIKRAGYKLLVTPHTVTHHLRESSGGIRSFHDMSMWEHDEGVFQSYLRAWNIKVEDTKLIVCDFGLGDHLILKGVWPELRRKFPDRKYTLAVCFPEVFKDEPDVTMISIAEAKLLLGSRYDEHSVYRYAWDRNFVRPMSEVMLEFFSK